MDVELTGHGIEQFATPTLIGRRLLPADTAFLINLHADADVMALHGGTRSRSTTEQFVQSNVAHWRHYQFGLYILSEVDSTDRPIGRAGIRWDRDAGPEPKVDVSVMLAQSAWGRGLATEAAAAIVAIGLDLAMPLVAATQARHTRARRVAEKVGFEYWSDFERHGRGWARYRWPADRPPPATLTGPTSRR